jgi:tRNA 2-thiocytidine biosynthesis protein TtcA
LNLFFAGKLSSMPPRLVSDDHRHVVIRPLLYCAEAQLAALAEERGFPILPCNLCGSQAEAQRKQMKTLLAELERANPTLRQSMLAALGNVVPTHLLDRQLQRLAATATATTADGPAVPTAAGADQQLYDLRRLVHVQDT